MTDVCVVALQLGEAIADGSSSRKENVCRQHHRTGDSVALMRIMIVTGGLPLQASQVGNRSVADAY